VMNEPIGRAMSLAPEAAFARTRSMGAGSKLSGRLVHPATDEPKRGLSRRAKGE
jgi:hypothetical protein